MTSSGSMSSAPQASIQVSPVLCCACPAMNFLRPPLMRHDEIGQLVEAGVLLGDAPHGAAMRHDDESVADLERVIEVVRDEDAGHAALRQVAHDGQHLLGRAR